MPDTALCAVPHYTWPETLCTEPAGHYRPDIDPHAAPLIINGRHCGGCAWDTPSIGWRWYPDLREWLPVCGLHMDGPPGPTRIHDPGSTP